MLSRCRSRRAPRLPAWRLTTELRFEPSGLLRVRHTLTNTGASPYRPAGLRRPVAGAASRPASCSTSPGAGAGSGRRSAARSRTARGCASHGAAAPGTTPTLLLLAGTAGLRLPARRGLGRPRRLERQPRAPGGTAARGCRRSGAAVLGGGELLLPGEVSLAPGEQYTSPWVVFSCTATGLDGADRAGSTAALRARPHHPRRPRPLVLNTWEAVYFDHDLERLTALADAPPRSASSASCWTTAGSGPAATTGPAWVTGTSRRTSGRTGCARWPSGCVGSAWTSGSGSSPEMVNVDSDLVRAHPDWAASAPATARPAAAAPVAAPVRARPRRPAGLRHLLERIDALMREVRDRLHQVGPQPRPARVAARRARRGRRPACTRQTLALYRLLDELRRPPPRPGDRVVRLGGARVDLGILEHTDRVWASDTNDALERQLIQRWTGAAAAARAGRAPTSARPRSHTTRPGRRPGFRGVTALFGHPGIEWDVTTCTDTEVEQLQRWAAFYKEQRGAAALRRRGAARPVAPGRQ